jgi:hypothetical protein
LRFEHAAEDAEGVRGVGMIEAERAFKDRECLVEAVSSPSKIAFPDYP